MKIQVVHLAIQKDIGPHLIIEETGLFWLTMQALGDEVFPAATFHLLCCHLPAWTEKIRWGKLDEDGWTPRSLSHVLWTFGQWLWSGCGAWKHYRNVGYAPVSAAWVHEHYPDADPIFSGDSDDAMNMRPGDEGDLAL